MAATPSIKIVKSFSYRGETRQFSNRYHFNGGTPPDSAHWTTLADNVTAAEKAIYRSYITIVEAIGYNAGSEVPVFTKSYSLAGTWAPGVDFRTPGDAAALVRYATAVRTAKNHPVYLFNYYHGANFNAASTPDVLSTAQAALLSTYASGWISGYSDGATSYNRAGPNGANAVGVLVEPNITHRDLPR